MYVVQWIDSSVAKLGKFLTVLVANSPAKVAQILGDFLGYFEKCTFWPTLGKAWANFWSHWSMELLPSGDEDSWSLSVSAAADFIVFSVKCSSSRLFFCFSVNIHLYQDCGDGISICQWSLHWKLSSAICLHLYGEHFQKGEIKIKDFDFRKCQQHACWRYKFFICARSHLEAFLEVE